MHARAAIAVDEGKLNAALARFPHERAMGIDGRGAHGGGETIERLSPTQGILVTRAPRGGAAPSRPRGWRSTRAPGVGHELGHDAVKDYTEEKTFHVHNGQRTRWRLPRSGTGN